MNHLSLVEVRMRQLSSGLRTAEILQRNVRV